MKGGKKLVKAALFRVLICLSLVSGSLAQTVPQQDILTSLSSGDVQMIIQDEAKNNPRALASLAKDPEQRKKVLENLGQALAVAGEARRTGFASEESVRMQLELAEFEVLAVAYDDKLKADAGKAGTPTPPFAYIADEAVDAFFNDPANKAKYDAEQKKFLAFVDDVQKKSAVPQEMSGEQMQYVISQWKKITYGAAKAKELNLADRKIQLQYKLQQAIILARTYSEEKLGDQLTPTGPEIKAYIEANPKFSKKTQRARAESVLAKVKAGGNFAALADQYTEDPGNKNAETGKPQGGLYDWKSRSVYVKEFSDAAWSLQKGQTSDLVETQFGYHIIKLEDKRIEKNAAGKDDEQVKVRHILISTMYKEEPTASAANVEINPGPSMISMEDAAKQELSRQKQKKVLDDITARNPIVLPADFTVEVPADIEVKMPAPVVNKVALTPKAATPKSAPQTLPLKIKSYLNLKYPGWKLSLSEKGCGENANKGFVSGDFNGDRKRDYAVKFTRNKKGYILAFLNLAKGFKPFVLHDTEAEEVKYLSLDVLKKGMEFPFGGANDVDGKTFRLKYDAPQDYRCESDVGGIHYYRNGKFVGY